VTTYAPSDLSVVIPTRDRWPILARTLAALESQTVRGFETLVVVDGADQHPPELAARVIVKEHGGPGAARNLGANASERRLVLFLGDDMIPTPDLVARHLARHNSEPELEVAVLGHVDWHPDVPRSRLLRWIDSSGTQFDFRNIVGSEAGFGRFYSCNVSLKRAFFLDGGGFDEDFVFDYEDLDCGWRLGERGMRLLYEPGARALHLHEYDWSRLVQRWESRAGAEQLMAAKHAWFEPWFAARIRAAARDAPVSKVWPLVVDVVPRRLTRLRRGAESRADRWYLQHLAPAFLRALADAGDVERPAG
jgi:GT2 family glycosyltransferase